MFKAFPIIDLMNQSDVINQAIEKTSLSRYDVLVWLDYYGIIKCPTVDSREIITTSSFWEWLGILKHNPQYRFTFMSRFGYFDAFNFVEDTATIDVLSRGWYKPSI